MPESSNSLKITEFIRARQKTKSQHCLYGLWLDYDSPNTHYPVSKDLYLFNQTATVTLLGPLSTRYFF